MKFFVVSGLSGAGKTIALHSLEDMGVYCIDNLPIALLPALAAQAPVLETEHESIAVGIDTRTTDNMEMLLAAFEQMQIPYEIVFLDASDAVLIKRYSETRRKHPLTTPELALAEAIRLERCLLEPIAGRANIRIDTSQMNVHQLRDMIRQYVGADSEQNLSLLLQSFGYKHGIPQDADFIFDVRCLPNPHWQLELRPLTGRDPAVIDFLQRQSKVQLLLQQLSQFLMTWIPDFIEDNRRYITIAIGCTGGQHRSVYVVEQLAKLLRQTYKGLQVRHRELP